jgi:DNA-binding beta-propeller fold protein YncE
MLASRGAHWFISGMALGLTVVAPAWAEAPAFLHVQHRVSGLSTFVVGSGGTLAPIPQPPLPGQGHSIAFDPAGRALYVDGIFGPETVRRYGIVGAVDGRPDPEWSEFPTFSGPPQYMGMHPSGRFLYTSSGTTGVVSVLRVAELEVSPIWSEGMPVPAVGLLAEPRGRFLYAAHATLGVSAFRADPTGTLQAVEGSPFGVEPLSGALAADPEGRFLYLASASSARIHAFRIDGSSGAPVPVFGSPYAAGANPQQLVVDPSGRFLYATNDDGSVTGFAISVTGSLAPVLGSPFTAGAQPRGILTDLRGRFVYVANRGSNDISAFAIDAKTGTLSPLPGSPFASGGVEPWAMTLGRNFTRGDIQADARTDLLWRHVAAGQNAVWLMNGSSLLSGALTNPATLDPDWTVGGTHDFDGDRQTDILWRHRSSGENVFWYMDGPNMTGGTFLTPPTLSPAWAPCGTGDFDGDGRPDIVWQHVDSGHVMVWFMAGKTRRAESLIYQSPFHPADWRVEGVGDFNLDRLPDLLWRNGASGEMLVWFWTGSALGPAAATAPPALGDLGWKLVALGDYNDDRHTDLVWSHSGSGQIAVWLMAGTALAGGTFTTPPSAGDLDWRIVGPR